MAHLLMDFGEVISLAQRETDVRSMALAAGVPPAEFTARYWECRRDYDCGLSALGFWTDVLNGPPGGQLLAHLVERDVSSWLYLNPVTMQLLGRVHAAGVPVSLLSNAPRELARELDRHDALRTFAHKLYSADLGVAKPDPAVYLKALAVLGEAPADVVFVDDRAENVAAAAALGIRAIRFTETPECLAEIERAVSFSA
ncbi:HAD-IA family hydrolase [Symbioplanes lichenis]|uniref:HAD-IA family hydrolase n=1 Tax=Symbioplanes lichenis TaxID=1629072 RepID=UPI0027390DDD|nr:HAD-IA family hydrolase [Actinoplanes lichenis]